MKKEQINIWENAAKVVFKGKHIALKICIVGKKRV